MGKFFGLMRRLSASHAGLLVALGFVITMQLGFGQVQPGPSVEPALDAMVMLPAPVPAGAQSQDHTRILWILPNNKTYASTTEYQPIGVHEKFQLASQDSFDRGMILTSLGLSAKGELFHATPQFGQGVEGYTKYFGAGYTDLILGNYLTEAVYPILLHQDPRYFRLGTGTGWRRLGHAVGQVFWTRSDSGRGQFNYSEMLGNSTAVAISNAYYPNDHTAEDAVEKLFVQVALDMSGNVMKEFWPDVNRRLHHKHAAPLRP